MARLRRERGERGMEEKNAARPQRTNSDKAEEIAAAMGLPLHSGPYNDDEKRAILEAAFPIGYWAVSTEDPALSGLPGRWVEIGKVWERVE